MRFQIDTTNKTITIEESILLSDLFTQLNMLFPEDSWKEYTLVQRTITNSENPIVINNIPKQPNYLDPPWIVTCSANINIPKVGTNFNLIIE